MPPFQYQSPRRKELQLGYGEYVGQNDWRILVHPGIIDRSVDVCSMGHKMNKVTNGQTTEDGFSEECGLMASATNDRCCRYDK